MWFVLFCALVLPDFRCRLADSCDKLTFCEWGISWGRNRNTICLTRLRNKKCLDDALHFGTESLKSLQT